jgi:23S rRNA (uracil1939-C5)-methyltransferase
MTELRVEAAVYGGYTLGREEGVVFIRGAIPGERVEVAIEEKKRDYATATVREVLLPSAHRVSPPCEYFGVCGGCHLQYISYERQVSMKADILKDSLLRIGGLRVSLDAQIAGVPFGYRRRGQFKVDPRSGSLGLYREATRDVVPIAACPLMHPSLSELYSSVRATDLAGVREVHITAGEKGIVALLRGRSYDDGLAERFAAMGFSGVAFEDKSFRSEGYVTFDLGGLVYTVSPWSFFQSNWELNRRVTGLLDEMLASAEDKRVLDLYAGGGNFSLPLARKARSVVAVEESAHSVRDGMRNALMNKIANLTFIEGRAESAKIKGEFDIVLLNPPRPGLSKAVVERVLALAPETVVYMSCNPSTLARDLKKITTAYDLRSIRMMDFFPNTFHIESLAVLDRRVV